MEQNNKKPLVKNPIFWIVIVILIVIIGLSSKNVFVNAKKEDKKTPEDFLKVKVTKAIRGPIQQWVSGEGTVRSVKREFLKFEQPGKVTYIGKTASGTKLKEGSSVSKGQLLASIDSRQQSENYKAQKATVQEALQGIEAAKAGLNQARKNLDFEKIKLNRAKKLFEKEALSADEFESMEARYLNAETTVKSAEAKLNVAQARLTSAKSQLSKADIYIDQTKIVSPINGKISYLNIKEGEYTSPQTIDTSSEQRELETTPIVIIDPGEYEITLNLPSYDGKLVNIGQEVFITWGDNTIPKDIESIDDLKAQPFALGKVYSVNPSISPGGRTIQVKVRTYFGSKLLRDGLFVSCWIVVKDKKDTLIAPYKALIYRNVDTYTFVYDPETKTVSKRKISIGVEGMEQSEILNGLKEGELVVTDGRYSLVEGAPVQIVKEEGEE